VESARDKRAHKIIGNDEHAAGFDRRPWA
jgi:hypothetical protein